MRNMALKKKVVMLKKKVSDQGAKITKLNTKLDGQKTTFEEARKAVNKMDALKDAKKQVQASLEAIIIKCSTDHKSVKEVKIQLA